MRAFRCFAHSPHRSCRGFRNAPVFEAHIPIDGTWLGSTLFLVQFFRSRPDREKKSELTTARCAALYKKQKEVFIREL